MRSAQWRLGRGRCEAAEAWNEYIEWCWRGVSARPTPCFCHKLLPHRGSVPAENQVFGRTHAVPGAAVDFRFELARRPAGKARIKPHPCRRLRDQRLEVPGMHAEIDVRQHAKRFGFRLVR